MRYRYLTTLEAINKRIAGGRGQGTGSEYRPWLTVHDFPSQGRVHRLKGWKHGRVHHLFSDLERNVFLHYQFPELVIDIREQYPLLPLEETLLIAKEIGVQHPRDPRTKHPVVLTTDLFLTHSKNLEVTYHPRTVKYFNDLQKPRTLQKLEIERRYWARRGHALKIITERHISTVVVKNMLWLHPYYRLMDLYPLTIEDVNKIASVLSNFIAETDRSLRVVTKNCDEILKLQVGTSLSVVRHLLANQYWRVDMKKPIQTNVPIVLITSPGNFLDSEKRSIAC